MMMNNEIAHFSAFAAVIVTKIKRARDELTQHYMNNPQYISLLSRSNSTSLPMAAS